MKRILPGRASVVGHRACAGLALVAALAGCAVSAPAPSDTDDARVRAPVSAELRALADEMVGVFARVGRLGPDRVGAWVSTRDEPALTEALEASLTSAGYRLERADVEAATPVAYAVRSVPDGVTVTVGMESVQVRRSYSGSLRAPVPAGPLYVRGTDAGALRAPREPAPVEILATARPPVDESIETPDPTATVEAFGATERAGSTRVPVSIALRGGRDGTPALDGLVARALGTIDEPDTVRNVMQVGESNFADLFATYRTVSERILVFPNDSRRLGDDNKALIAAELERFRPATDLFSVVGCSFGPTRIDNGNEVLALGRANRVVEELVATGVPSSRVVDEGCWAGDASERFPNRGVVLTLKRRENVIDG